MKNYIASLLILLSLAACKKDFPNDLAGVYYGNQICYAPYNYTDTTKNINWTIQITGKDQIFVDGQYANFTGASQGRYTFENTESTQPFRITIYPAAHQMQMSIHISAGESCECIGYK